MNKQGIENLYEPDCIRTFSGHYVNVFNPDPSTIVIEDIAHALSMIPRWGGHCYEPFSVAQHCVLACRSSALENKLSALMHDASEAYLLDIPSPIKKKLTNYYEIEDSLMKVIALKFKFQWPLSEAVIATDKGLLEMEWRNIILDRSENWRGWSQKGAEINFIKEYEMLTGRCERTATKLG